MTVSVSNDAQTQSIPRVPAMVVAVADAAVAAAAPGTQVAAPDTDTEVAAPAPDTEVAAPAPDTEVAASAPDTDTQVAAPAPDVEVGREQSVEEMYEAGLATLHALHDRWAAAMAELRAAEVMDEPGEAAA